MNHETIYLSGVISWASMLVLLVCCTIHIIDNMDKHSGMMERLGFVLTAAGAFGQVVYRWWPKIEAFPIEVILHVGLAALAINFVHGRVRGYVSRWYDRRVHTGQYRAFKP